MAPTGDIRFISGIKIAHLALKHRQGKNHKTRIVAFVGSPIEADEKEMVKLAKKLKKEKVNIDIVNFGEDASNADILNKFITTINGKEGTGSHLVTIPPGPHLSDALVSSPILQGTIPYVRKHAGRRCGLIRVPPHTSRRMHSHAGQFHQR